MSAGFASTHQTHPILMWGALEREKCVCTHIRLVWSEISFANIYYNRCVSCVRIAVLSSHFFSFHHIDISVIVKGQRFQLLFLLAFRLFGAAVFCKTFMTVCSLFSCSLPLSTFIRSIRLFTFYGNRVGTNHTPNSRVYHGKRKRTKKPNTFLFITDTFVFF